MKKNVLAAIVVSLLLLFLTDSNAQNADVNGDGVVNIFDLVSVASHFGERVDAAQMSNIDVNSDGIVDVRDLVIVANSMQQGDMAPTGGTLIFGRGGDSLTLDPIQVLDGESAKVCDMLYDTLIQYREDTTDIEPALAETWASSADGLV
jgi:ABC-type transport system substrate-binding protein